MSVLVRRARALWSAVVARAPWLGQLARFVWRYLSFVPWSEGWGLPAEVRARQRAGWPAWRRSVRPVGIVLGWSAFVYFSIHPDNRSTTDLVVRIVWGSAILGCAALGVAGRISGRRAVLASTPASIQVEHRSA